MVNGVGNGAPVTEALPSGRPRSSSWALMQPIPAGGNFMEAGWKSDPTGRHEQRYFDGSGWTAHVNDAGIPSSDPYIEPAIEPGPAADSPQAEPTETAGSPKRRVPQWAVIAGAVGGVLVLIAIVGAIAGSSEDSSKANRGRAASALDAARDTTTTEPPTTTTNAPTTGSRGAPLALGTVVTLGDWEIAVVGFQPDANAAMRNENMFNDPAPAGSTYSLVRVRATYRGSGDDSASSSIGVGFVGSDNRKYADSDCMAVEPNALGDQPSVFSGGSVEGNVCLVIPTAQIPTGAIYVEDSFSFEDSAAWWRTS